MACDCCRLRKLIGGPREPLTNEEPRGLEPLLFALWWGSRQGVLSSLPPLDRGHSRHPLWCGRFVFLMDHDSNPRGVSASARADLFLCFLASATVIWGGRAGRRVLDMQCTRTRNLLDLPYRPTGLADDRRGLTRGRWIPGVLVAPQPRSRVSRGCPPLLVPQA